MNTYKTGKRNLKLLFSCTKFKKVNENSHQKNKLYKCTKKTFTNVKTYSLLNFLSPCGLFSTFLRQFIVLGFVFDSLQFSGQFACVDDFLLNLL